jgi:hypothetical protein
MLITLNDADLHDVDPGHQTSPDDAANVLEDLASLVADHQDEYPAGAEQAIHEGANALRARGNAHSSGTANEEIRHSIAELVNYSWVDEEHDYVTSGYHDDDGHIFTYLQRVDAWLQAFNTRRGSKRPGARPPQPTA